MSLCRNLYNTPYIVTPEAAIKADMIWADFLKESQQRLKSTGNNHNQAEITLTLNKQKKHLCIDCIVADVL
jgi:hypothetical protein